MLYKRTTIINIEETETIRKKNNFFTIITNLVYSEHNKYISDTMNRIHFSTYLGACPFCVVCAPVLNFTHVETEVST